MKKLTATLFTFCLLTFGCDRCPQVQRYFDIEGVQLQNSFISSAANDPDFNASSFADSIRFEYFELKALHTVRYYSLNRQPSFSFVPAAYALDCVMDGDGGTSEKIESLTLLALSDYNLRFKTGDTLNEITKIYGLPIARYIETQNQSTLNQIGFQLNFTERPDTAIKHSFKLVYKLQNGETYEAESQPITIH